MPKQTPRPSPPERPRTLFHGLKGGVGKTTLTAQLAAALTRRGLSVLLVDVDPQGSLTFLVTGMRVRHLQRHIGTILVDYAHATGSTQDRAVAARSLTADTLLRMHDATLPISTTHHRRAWGDLHILPGHPDLAWLKIEREGLLDLGNILDACDGDYDAVLIDAGPSANPLALVGLYAAHQVVAVTTPSALSLEGLDQMFALMGTVRSHHTMTMAGVVANKVRRHYRERAYRLEELETQLGSLLLQPPLSEHTVVEDASGAHLPVHAMGGATAAMLTHRYDTLADTTILTRSR